MRRIVFGNMDHHLVIACFLIATGALQMSAQEILSGQGLTLCPRGQMAVQPAYDPNDPMKAYDCVPIPKNSTKPPPHLLTADEIPPNTFWGTLLHDGGQKSLQQSLSPGSNGSPQTPDVLDATQNFFQNLGGHPTRIYFHPDRPTVWESMVVDRCAGGTLAIQAEAPSPKDKVCIDVVTPGSIFLMRTGNAYIPYKSVKTCFGDTKPVFWYKSGTDPVYLCLPVGKK